MIPTDQLGVSHLRNGHLPLTRETSALIPEVELAETVIHPRTGWVAVDWNELIHGRELLYFFIWRDIKVRYKQTVIGIAWAVLQPLCTLLIFSFVFGRLAHVPSEDLPYPVFAFAGLIPWMFFSQGVSAAGQSLVNQQHLLSKIYFPRLFIPTAVVGAYLLDMMISFGLYAGILAIYGVTPSWQIILMPVLVALTIVATLGAGFALSALTAMYRDFRAIVPFLLQITMFLSPVIYPAYMIPNRFRLVAALNPMYGIIDAYRSSILGRPWNLDILAISTAASFALLTFGLFYFRKAERLVVDIV
jgi:lipopolysaccharide transport system permease protein